MVTTRRGARSYAPRENDSSSDNESIPARTPPAHRRTPASRTPVTLRPPRGPVPRNASLSKRKREPSGAFNAPQKKRRRLASDVANTIEVQGEDDNVDAAINATSGRPAYRLEIRLPSVRGPEESGNVNSVEDIRETSTTGVPGRRLRAKRLKRGINSVEIFDASDSQRPRKRRRGPDAPHVIMGTPEPDSDTGPAEHRNDVAESAVEEVPAGPESLHPGGSPELQSSAAKRRPARPLVHVYDVPEDDDSELPNLAAIRRTTVTNLEASNRGVSNTRQARQPRSPQRNDRLPFVREEQLEPATPVPLRRELHQAVVPGGASRSLDEGDFELVVYGNRRQANQINDGGSERPQNRGERKETDDMDDTDNVEETDESESDDEGEQRKMDDIQVRPCVNNEDTITAYSGHLTDISKLMGRSGWTGAGQRWKAQLYASMPEFGVNPHIRTGLGKRIFRSLSCLKDEFDEVPNALDLTEQYQYLAEHQLVLNATISGVDKAVRKVESLTNTRLPERLVNDLSTYAIPMLVLVMQASFAIGVRQPDAVVDDAPSREGVFTWTTIQYLLGTLGWLSRLQKCLTAGLSVPSGGSLEYRARQRYDFEDPTQNRQKLGVMVKKFIHQIRQEVDSFNVRADANQERYEEEQRIAEMREQDRKIREQRQREADEELALARQEEEKFRRSIQQVTNQVRPLAEKFRKATLHWFAPAQSIQPRTQYTNPSVGTSSHRESRAGHTAPQSRQTRPASPSPELDYPPWPEDDTEWLLGELRRPDRESGCLDVWVETLERSPEEIMAEKRRLERTGRYRSPTRRR
ncbi:hypothetical protein B0I37DRAFT_203823 [Chaetomium sp. MPI-CAGE-AT-0009]|nr:hypothetical protein B0I37DRAFT_203823 [Chaetomium sp. MPI-CAGE-AT-0009]